MNSTMPLVGPSLAIFIVSMVMMILSVVAVSLRTFVRLYIVRAFGWDDILMLAALVRCPLHLSNYFLTNSSAGVFRDL